MLVILDEEEKYPDYTIREVKVPDPVDENQNIDELRFARIIPDAIVYRFRKAQEEMELAEQALEEAWDEAAPK